MGLKKFFKKNKAAIIGGAVGGPIGAAAGIGFDKMGGFGGVKDLLFGKKEAGPQLPSDVASLQAQARGMQAQGLTDLQEAYKTPAEDVINQQVGMEQRAAAGAAQDARRKMQESIVRRGMTGSSIGLGQEVGLERNLMQQQQDIGASLPQRLQQEKLQRSQALMGAGGNVLGNMGEIFIPQKAKRSGGIASLLGAGVGAAFGGPAGAQMGMGIGQAAQGAFGG